MVRSSFEKLHLSIQGLVGVIIITAMAFLVLLVILGYHWVDRGVDTSPSASELSDTRDQRMVQYMIGRMVYFKDHRTGLCFAATQRSSFDDTSSLACVPCESVQHLLVPQPEPEQQPQQ